MAPNALFPRIRTLILSALLILSGCATPADRAVQNPAHPTTQQAAVEPVEGKLIQSQLAREQSPETSADNQARLASDNLAFAMELYHQLAGQPGNLLLSPYSISQALAMVYAGARGHTEQQMASVLHFNLPQNLLHPAFNALDQELGKRADAANDEGQGFQVNIANATWGQSGFAFLPAYLDLLAINYGAGMQTVDFANDPEEARQAINDWVAKQTQGKIKDIIPQGSIDWFTRLVLADAIYFKAAWLTPFDKAATQAAPFTTLNGSQVSVPMMSLEQTKLKYLQGDGFQAVALPYVDRNVAMLLLVPDAGRFTQFEAGLDAATLQAILG
ncbi:MAG TPA: serpin family protein, partial [Desulfobaccales bacterium]|nr:serpin family protein [Desulfobaccales bacterium]